MNCAAAMSAGQYRYDNATPPECDEDAEELRMNVEGAFDYLKEAKALLNFSHDAETVAAAQKLVKGARELLGVA